MTTAKSSLHQFESSDFLNAHIQSTLDFYEPRVVDNAGGFFQTFRDNGDVYDATWRHLVSSSRFVYNYATAYRKYGKPQHLEWAQHGLDFLQNAHLQTSGHYAWELRDGAVSDGRAMAYGHAFVMLSGASALRAGIEQGRLLVAEMWDFLEQSFWQPEYRAYADERDASLQTLHTYRGQNANMHICEALLAAFEATGDGHYLDRAEVLANRFAGELASLNDGLIWEHYSSNWQLDMQYNIDKPDDLFKPWGFQPGHHVEWAKLLLQLNAFRPDSWLVKRASELYEVAIDKGWDDEFGGLVYGFAPDGSFSDAHKYFWVHAEAFAAAWRLYRITGDERYQQDYQRIWAWSWRYLIDHQYGAWFRIRNRDGSPVDDLKSPPGKTDYHTMGACWDVLDNID
jgi:mannose/cellobiose epimerase-like protein (N-acyl-D-glucosamine 2-epimerase family)